MSNIPSNEEVYHEALQRIADGAYTETGAEQHAKDILKAIRIRSVRLFKVGDRVRWKYGSSSYTSRPFYNGITVTEITERGFKWRLDKPHCIHPLYGTYQEGETFAPETYELEPHEYDPYGLEGPQQ